MPFFDFHKSRAGGSLFRHRNRTYIGVCVRGVVQLQHTHLLRRRRACVCLWASARVKQSRRSAIQANRIHAHMKHKQQTYKRFARTHTIAPAIMPILNVFFFSSRSFLFLAWFIPIRFLCCMREFERFAPVYSHIRHIDVLNVIVCGARTVKERETSVHAFDAAIT